VQAAELERLNGLYFLDRVLNRAQVLERCRRIYELSPFDPRNPALETQQLLLMFQQLDENHFTVANWVAAAAVEIDEELGRLIATDPTLVLPDPTDIAIADVALFIEFQRELLLQSIKERQQLAAMEESREARLWARADEKLIAMAETALREACTLDDMLLLGIQARHLGIAITRIGEDAVLPFDLSEYMQRTGENWPLEVSHDDEEEASDPGSEDIIED
jgi:hypothetical protein